MRRSSIDERRDDVTSKWIARSAKIISQLHNEVEDTYKSWEGMTAEEIERYLSNLPSWMEREEKGYAVGNFHCCMELHAGPLHHRLFKSLLLPENKEKEEEDYIYGGGFDFLDREDVEFLNNNGYVVVDGPRGPECLIKHKAGLLKEVIGKSAEKAKYDDIFVGKLTEGFDLWVKAGGKCLVVKKEGNYLWPSLSYKKNISSTMALNASIEEMFSIVTTLEEFIVTKDGECFPKK